MQAWARIGQRLDRGGTDPAFGWHRGNEAQLMHLAAWSARLGRVAVPDASSAEQPTDETPPNSVGGAASGTSMRGLHDGFDAYCTPTRTDFVDLLTGGMVVLDTNVLLDLYRYHQFTRDDFLLALDALKERLWIPHQVVKEFWKNREQILLDPRESDKTSKELESQSINAVRILRTWTRRVRLPTARADELSNVLEEAFTKVIGEVKKLASDDGREFARDTNNDPLLLALAPILAGHVGHPFGKAEYDAAIVEAKRRGKESIPPGYMDIGKEGLGPAGDYLLWAQLLQRALNRKNDVLFVTADDKEDWWRKDKTKSSLGPRPELVEELRSTANVRLFMLAPDNLLSWAKDVFDLSISNESVQEVKRVSKTAFIAWKVQDHHIALRSAGARLVNIIVRMVLTDFESPVLKNLQAPLGIVNQALGQQDLGVLLSAVWSLIDAVPNTGLFDPQKQLSGPELEAKKALQDIREEAISAWLEDAADRAILAHISQPDLPWNLAPFPPTVVIVEAQPGSGGIDGVRKVEFAAHTTDNSSYVTTRTIPANE
jgi:histone H3/H4